MGEGASEVTERDDVLASDDQTTDPEVERLVEDIEETREEMTITVEEIGDRLDPRNIVEGAKETVKAATVGKVEDMANTAGSIASDATETVREAGSGIMQTITSNPIPAAMAAIGLGWLAMNRRQSNRGSWTRYPYGSGYGSSADRWSDQARGSGYRDSDYEQFGSSAQSAGMTGQGGGPGELIGQAQERAGEVADRVGRKVDETAQHVGQMAEQVPYQVRTMTQDLGDQASRMFQGNPLAVGAIAVAVGTAVGLAMPVSEAERRMIAEPAQKALSKAEDVASEKLEQVEQQARDVEQQAREEDRQARPH